MFASYMPLTTIDYPGKLSCILFTSGCNLRCPYCHNQALVLSDHPDVWDEIYTFLKRRQGILDGVVISGGEPLIHHKATFISRLKQIKQLGFDIKLDTNGTLPAMLESVIATDMVDYIAMDIKGALDSYRPFAPSISTMHDQNKLSADLERSISLIVNSGIDHEFRTTAVFPYITVSSIETIGVKLKKLGVSNWIFQEAKLGEDNVLDPTVHMETVPLDICVHLARAYVPGASKR